MVQIIKLPPAACRAIARALEDENGGPMLGSQLLAGRRVVQPRSPPPVRASSFVSVSSLETLPRDISRLPESDELHVVKVTGERAPGHHPPSRTMAKASESLPCKIIWDGDRLEIQLPRNLDLPNSVQACVKDLSRRATGNPSKLRTCTLCCPEKHTPSPRIPPRRHGMGME